MRAVAAAALLLAGCGSPAAAPATPASGPAGVPAMSPSGPAGVPAMSPSGSATASGPAASAGPVHLVPDDYAGRFRIAATVLQDERHGPQLCVNVSLSLPPRCGGPDVAGWDWASVPHETSGPVRWGSYVVVGTFDGRTFTLTEPPKADDGGAARPGRVPDLRSPCPVPPGGWRAVDPAKADGVALGAATRTVEAASDFAGLWVDGPVLNVRFTGDLARHEADLREVWGGALCVTRAARTLAELRTIQQDLAAEPGTTNAAVDVVSGTVEVGVHLASQGRQRTLDAKYGPGVVHLAGALEPVG